MNPFIGISGRSVSGEYFAGRQRELGLIASMAKSGGNLVITGIPRIGKTSLLNRFTEMAGNAWLPDTRLHVLNADVLALQEDPTAAILSIAKEMSLDIDTPDDFVRVEIPSTVLCIDEYQTLCLSLPKAAKFLRVLSDRPEITIIAVWHQESLSAELDPYPINTFYRLPLGPFSHTDVSKLIERYLLFSNINITFSDEEISRIYEFSDGHPQKVQIACYYLYEMKCGKTKDWIADFNAASIDFWRIKHRDRSPAADSVDMILNVLKRTLRKAFFDTPPQKETDLQNAIDLILTAAGFDFLRINVRDVLK